MVEWSSGKRCGSGGKGYHNAGTVAGRIDGGKESELQGEDF